MRQSENIVNALLEADIPSPYDFDDPIEREAGEAELAQQASKEAEDEALRLWQSAETSSVAAKAANTYLDRKSRKAHPNGSFDKAGRWYPSADEKQDCCSSVRSPTRSWPYSLMLHCRTAPHVANLYGVTVQELKAHL